MKKNVVKGLKLTILPVAKAGNISSTLSVIGGENSVGRIPVGLGWIGTVVKLIKIMQATGPILAINQCRNTSLVTNWNASNF